MPVTRFLCPVTTNPVDFDTCRACAATQGVQEAPDGTKSHCHLPYSMLNTLMHAQDHRRGIGVSVTQLTHCWRKAWMETRWDYDATPESLWAAQHGTMVHDGLERALNAPGAWKETRLYKRLANGMLLSGQFDVWWPALGLIEDYKCKSSAFALPPEEYILQQNLYRWMLMTGCTYRPDPTKEDEVALLAEQPITDLVLYSVTHSGMNKVSCPLLDFAELEAWALAGTTALTQASQDVVARHYTHPKHTSFCQSFCVFQEECRLSTPLLMPTSPVKTPKAS